MNRETFVCSPKNNRLSSFQPLAQRNSLTYSFILLCLMFTAASATAQTRSTRTSSSNKQEERARRVNKVEDADDEDGDEVEETKQPAQNPPQNPLVRKTALTYPVRNGNQTSTTPALTNDIVIISRANVSSIPTSGTLGANAGAAVAHMPNIWPVMGSLSSGFGVRNNPFGGYSREFHKGQDIAVPLGTPIMATADGVVVSACWHHGYGNAIYIDHGNGIMTRYGHLSRIDVREGQTVKRGDLIGLSGSTGRSTGPHLHYEVRINGEATNPLPYLPPVTSPVQAK